MLENISILFLPIMVLIILTFALLKKVSVYEEFVEGAKDGFSVSIKIIPYLVALIVGISMFRASGAMDLLTKLLGPFLDRLSVHADIIPIILTRSLSGSDNT